MFILYKVFIKSFNEIKFKLCLYFELFFSGLEWINFYIINYFIFN